MLALTVQYFLWRGKNGLSGKCSGTPVQSGMHLSLSRLSVHPQRETFINSENPSQP